MPKGPHGQKRPAAVIGCAVRVARLAVGVEAGEARAQPGRVRSGHVRATARAGKRTSDERSAAAKWAGTARWG